MDLFFDFIPLFASPLIDELNKVIFSQLFVTFFFFQIFNQIDNISWACTLEDILLELLILFIVLLGFKLFELFIPFDENIL